MQKKFLKIAPYGILLIVFIVASSLLLWDIQISKSNIHVSSFLIHERGKSILQTIESNIIASNVNTKERLDDLIMNYALQDDVEFIALANERGEVLISNNSAMIGQMLPVNSPACDMNNGNGNFCINLDFSFDEAKLNKTEYIIVQRTLFRSRPPKHSMHSQHRRERFMQHRSDFNRNLNAENRQLFLVVGFKTEEIMQAKLLDDRKILINTIAFGFLLFMSILSFILLKKYQKYYQLIEESKVYFDGLMTTIPLGIITINMQNTIITCNPITEKMFKSGNLTGKNICDFIPAIAYLDFNKPVINALVKIAGNSGNNFELNSFSINIDNEKKAIGIILRDLKEIQKLQEELNRKDKLASVGQLAAGIAHEIRNPLSSIRGFARIFAENAKEGSEEKALAQIMNQEICRVDKVISDLLEFSKPNTLVLNKVSLQKLIEQVEKSLMLQAKEHGIRFVNEIAIQELTLDFDRMIQVFYNLLINSIEAMHKISDADKKTITIKAWQEQNNALITIQDKGQGIPQNKLSSLFTPYYTTKAKGTGLGLVIVQKIIEAHKGTVKAESEENAGTTFIITLPIN